MKVLCNHLQKLNVEKEISKEDKKICDGLEKLRQRIEGGDNTAFVVLLIQLIDSISWLENFSSQKHNVSKDLGRLIPIWPILAAPKNLKDARKHLQDLGVGIEADFPHLSKRREKPLANQDALAILISLEEIASIDPCLGDAVMKQVFPDGLKMNPDQFKKWWSQVGRSFLKETIKSEDRLQVVSNYINPRKNGLFGSEEESKYLSKCLRSLRRILVLK